MDSETNKHFETVDTLEKIETVIHASNTSGVPLEFVTNSEKNVEPVKQFTNPGL